MRIKLLAIVAATISTVLVLGMERCLDAVRYLGARFYESAFPYRLTHRIICRDDAIIATLDHAFQKNEWQGWTRATIIQGRLVAKSDVWWITSRCDITVLEQPVRSSRRNVLVGRAGRVEGMDTVGPPADFYDAAAPRTKPRRAKKNDQQVRSMCRAEHCAA